MEKESITGMMLDPDSFYGAVSEALGRFEWPDSFTERSLSQHVCIPSVRGFYGLSCTVDDMKFKMGEDGIVSAGRPKTSFLYDGDEGHCPLFVDVSAGEYAVHEPGSLFLAMKGHKTTADESEVSDSDDDNRCKV